MAESHPLYTTDVLLQRKHTAGEPDTDGCSVSVTFSQASQVLLPLVASVKEQGARLAHVLGLFQVETISGIRLFLFYYFLLYYSLILFYFKNYYFPNFSFPKLPKFLSLSSWSLPFPGLFCAVLLNIFS